MSYHSPKESLEETLRKIYSDRRMSTAWFLSKDFGPPTLNVSATASPTRQPTMVWDLGRICYHCDATDGVSGVVPLCRKCR